jgi:hypothetical protein
VSLARELLALRGDGVQLLYGEATAANTVMIAGSTVAVELPALMPVATGDYCAVLVAGADKIILGAVGGSQATYSPTLTAFGTGTQQYARWVRAGNLVKVSFGWYATGAGTAADLTVTVPFNFANSAAADAYESVGSGYWYDSSAALVHVLDVQRDNLNHRVRFQIDGGAGGLLGNLLANADDLRLSFSYEAA